MITVLKYQVSCDVQGCDKSIQATAEQLSSSSWGIRMLYGGIAKVQDIKDSKAVLHRLIDYGSDAGIVCPTCQAQGFYKTMAKE